ncbi:Cytochrome c551 peroxidase [uncultured Candidatus Thioglobus sp.]|nr:Cytochrome c551 peroxidase [uncultured Candidatus Thioglobus sp.]
MHTLTRLFSTLIIALTLSACGGGGGGGSNPDNTSSGSGVGGKGPFVEGSSVRVFALNNNGTRNTTTTITTTTTGDRGAYTFNNIGFSGVSEVEIAGFYLDENTGITSLNPATLTAVVNIVANSAFSTNINVFTDIEAMRIKALMADGNSLADARTSATFIVAELFGLTTGVSLAELDLIDGSNNNNLTLLRASAAIAKSPAILTKLRTAAESTTGSLTNSMTGSDALADLNTEITKLDFTSITETIVTVSDNPPTTDAFTILNIAPVLSTATLTVQTVDEDAAAFQIALSASDVNNNALTFTAHSVNGNLATVTTTTNGTTGVLSITPQPNDNGTTTIIVNVTDSAGGVDSRQFVLNVQAVNDPVTGSPTIDGSTIENQTLTVNTGNIADVDGLNTFSYQWKANGADISGATNTTLTLAQAQVGSTITVTASYTDDDGTPESVTSTHGGAVVAAPDIPTAAPTASVQSATQINLSWTEVNDANYYRLYQSSASIYDGSNLNYSHTGLTANTDYSYTLKACVNRQENTCSNVSPATTATTQQSIPNAPSTPTALTASVQSATQINLSWSIVSGASYYEIYRNTSDNNNALARIGNTVDPLNTYQDTGLDGNIQYYYWLKACNSTLCSDFSSVTSAIFPTLVTLGEKIFSDTNLSRPTGQSCASCHAMSNQFTDPDQTLPTSAGAVAGEFGTRNSPTAGYAARIPEFTRNTDGVASGGQFLDGRASTLELQARLPFLNPVEMNMPDEAAVITAIKNGSYANDFEIVFGTGVLNDVAASYTKMTEAIAAFERSNVFSPFTSKFDAMQNDLATFTHQEQLGFHLFSRQGGQGGVNCSRCHSDNGDQPIFSNFEYENIGVPKNAALLTQEGNDFIDLGLGGVSNIDSENGKFRVPTLRNVADTPPYMHNGVFNTLTEVVEFYNLRNAADAEVTANVTNDDVGNLNLNPMQIAAIVAFLRTLSDGYSNN